MGDGDNLIIGQNNTGTSTTQLARSGGRVSTGFSVHNQDGTGIFGHSDNAEGVSGRSQWGDAGVFGFSLSGACGVKGVVLGGLGTTDAGADGPVGVWGDSGVTGVLGTTSSGTAVKGACIDGVGVFGNSITTTGVLGTSIAGAGVSGSSAFEGHNYVVDGNFGVVGNSPNAGVAAFNPKNTHAAYLASDCCAAWFTGDVLVTGTLAKGGGGFEIDHPLDPVGKYLSHSFVESSEMKNFYDGVVTVDARGESVVELPVWFEALNGDFRYQLTSIGASAPNLHIAGEISNHRFKIAGAVPGTKVSWLVTGTRRDAWANANRVRVEKEKPLAERGRYLHPELYGASEDQSVARVRHPHERIRFAKTRTRRHP